MFKHYIQLFILALFLSGCRDYINDLVIDAPPVLTTDEQVYTLSDSATVTLFNQSTSPIYVTLVYEEVEVKSSSEWFLYSVIPCGGGCPEITVSKGQTISKKSRLVNSPGTYRLVCTYGKKPNAPPEEKYKVYSNEFTVN